MVKGPDTWAHLYPGRQPRIPQCTNVHNKSMNHIDNPHLEDTRAPTAITAMCPYAKTTHPPQENHTCSTIITAMNKQKSSTHSFIYNKKPKGRLSTLAQWPLQPHNQPTHPALWQGLPHTQLLRVPNAQWRQHPEIRPVPSSLLGHHGPIWPMGVPSMFPACKRL